MILIAQIPSLLVAPAAGILAAGILGNSLSAAWNDMEVPNPLLAGGDSAFIAFNLADIWALTGILALVLTIGDLADPQPRHCCRRRPHSGRRAARRFGGRSRTRSPDGLDKLDITWTMSGWGSSTMTPCR